jgi:hypothetical protein
MVSITQRGSRARTHACTHRSSSSFLQATAAAIEATSCVCIPVHACRSMRAKAASSQQQQQPTVRAPLAATSSCCSLLLKQLLLVAAASYCYCCCCWLLLRISQQQQHPPAAVRGRHAVSTCRRPAFVGGGLCEDLC